ncbi:guanine nucleotide-binding protein subunit beta-like protein 1 [Patiria miniata]|uniref:Guanine nucleotide-binding protein subunit beta-like protein 1 n=1 Tax=Patiria miniata TaxID=46514 RepID=A0A914ABL0_PATMI|nr:guanine nucleotide-binding protein subunit beta-like protein 1 [Patiria miniata]XP_038060841.1 guanine nucleotide-binding protein subunit beta-like protein 1 [Patiria miniata]XP_038060842.1 guanine nucleotide-binding protein subunit beta-like protein 1 [Patiria miniata]XP_038060843.1 guanine nucleotide-binding protein subunit beta-like protein 1 [Patiria miniata]
MAHQPPRPPDPLFVLRGSKDAVNCVKFYPSTHTEKGRLLSGSGCGEVRVWNLESRRTETVLDGHDGKSVLWVQPISNGQIISQGRDGNILTWDIGEGRRDVTTRLPSNALTFCKCDICNQGSPLVAAPGQDSEVCIIDLKSETVICGLKADKDIKKFGMPMCVKFIDESRLLIGYEAGQVALWDTSARTMLDNKQLHSEAVMCLDYSTSSKRGVSGSADDKLMCWTVSEAGLTLSAESTLTNPGISDVCIRQDDKIVASAGWDSRIRLFGWKKLKPLAVLSYHRQTIHTVDFSPPLQEFDSAQILAAGSKDKHISLWSVYNPS